MKTRLSTAPPGQCAEGGVLSLVAASQSGKGRKGKPSLPHKHVIKRLVNRHMASAQWRRKGSHPPAGRCAAARPRDGEWGRGKAPPPRLSARATHKDGKKAGPCAVTAGGSALVPWQKSESHPLGAPLDCYIPSPAVQVRNDVGGLGTTLVLVHPVLELQEALVCPGLSASGQITKDFMEAGVMFITAS